MRVAILLFVSLCAGMAQTTIRGTLDARGARATYPDQTGTLANRPSTCGIGQKYFTNDQAPNVEYVCTALNTWTQASGASSVWGGVTGLLSNQTDLAAALAAKQAVIATGSTAQYFRGDLSLAAFPAIPTIANGPLKGVGGNAVALGVTDLIALWSGCSGTMYLGFDGACHTASGGGYTLPAATTSAMGGVIVPASGHLAVDGSGNLSLASPTGSGNPVLATSPTLTSPNLGTPSAINLANATNLPHSALPALTGSDIPSNSANTSGNAGTASALASAPTVCAAGQVPSGILANGNSTGCAAALPQIGIRGQGTILFAHWIPSFLGTAWDGYQLHLSTVSSDGKTFQTLQPTAFYSYTGSGNQTFQDTAVTIWYPTDAPTGQAIFAGDGHDHYYQLQMVTSPDLLTYSSLITLDPVVGSNWSPGTTYNTGATNASPSFFIDPSDNSLHMLYQFQPNGSTAFNIYETHPLTQTLAGLSGTWSGAVQINATGTYIDPTEVKIGSTYYVAAKNNSTYRLGIASSPNRTGPFTFSDVSTWPAHYEKPSLAQLDANTWALWADYEFGSSPYAVGYSTDGALATWTAPQAINEPSGTGTYPNYNAGNPSYYVRAGSAFRTVDPNWIAIINNVFNTHPGGDHPINQQGSTFLQPQTIQGPLTINGNLTVNGVTSSGRTQQVLSAASPTITIPVPSSAYTNLRIELDAPGLGNPTTDLVYMQYNGDSTSNQYFGIYSTTTGSVAPTSTGPTDQQVVATLGWWWSSYTIKVRNYATAQSVKMGTAQGGSFFPASIVQSQFAWSSTAPITSILLGTTGGHSFPIGTTATLYLEP